MFVQSLLVNAWNLTTFHCTDRNPNSTLFPLWVQYPRISMAMDIVGM
jgi:hypothetical protein